MSELSTWGDFYSLIGSAAGTLIGLQFVILTLIVQKPITRGQEVGATFSTPTIVHFSAALLLSAFLRAPWPAMLPVAVLLGVIGICGFLYAAIVCRRLKRQRAYDPVLEDWIFFAALPLVAHATLAVSAFTILAHEQKALFAVGAATLLLLFIGIHNAWDSIAYHVFVGRQAEAEAREDETAKKKR